MIWTIISFFIIPIKVVIALWIVYHLYMWVLGI